LAIAASSTANISQEGLSGYIHVQRRRRQIRELAAAAGGEFAGQVAALLAEHFAATP